MYVHTYIRTYIHIYIHIIYIYTYIQTDIHTNVCTYMHTCTHNYVHTCIHTHIHTCMYNCMHETVSMFPYLKAFMITLQCLYTSQIFTIIIGRESSLLFLLVNNYVHYVIPTVNKLMFYDQNTSLCRS